MYNLSVSRKGCRERFSIDGGQGRRRTVQVVCAASTAAGTNAANLTLATTEQIANAKRFVRRIFVPKRRAYFACFSNSAILTVQISCTLRPNSSTRAPSHSSSSCVIS